MKQSIDVVIIGGGVIVVFGLYQHLSLWHGPQVAVKHGKLPSNGVGDTQDTHA